MLFYAAILATLCTLASSDGSPPYEYKGCSDQVGNYVLSTFSTKCGQWTEDSFNKYIQCKKSKGLDAEDAVEDCGREILKEDKPDVFGTVCPKMSSDKSKFMQYHMNCCLINHALEFSEKTWTESKQADQECLSA